MKSVDKDQLLVFHSSNNEKPVFLETGVLPDLSFSINPLSPNSDQQQFSPNNIHSLSRDKVMRINKMIIIEKIP